ncbi:MAG TPA: YkgJ family cysteine cluster protein [Bryobacteraceae bacterium]|jgi:Fe-S-cluster containining protein|nr:YkgJ family cysteine cluster protein [Bryobacteraceae bacterium]
MLTDLVQIRRLGQQKRDENFRFRAYLKNHRHSDRRLRRFGEEIEAQIDCTQCANCCRVSEVGITDRDIEKLAKFLGMSRTEFLRDSTQRDDEDGLILKKTEAGCVFLKDNLCTVYEARPQNCANFPHLVRGTGSIASRTWQFVDRAEYCPIVYNWIEKVKEDIGF